MILFSFVLILNSLDIVNCLKWGIILVGEIVVFGNIRVILLFMVRFNLFVKVLFRIILKLLDCRFCRLLLVMYFEIMDIWFL